MAVWVVLVHQLPSIPTNLRVRTWRRLQKLGAISLKQSVFVLPDSPTARAAFAQLKADIEGAGGSATVLAADVIDGSDDRLLRSSAQRRRPARLKPAAGFTRRATHEHARLWVTRPRPGVDRLASAWLIRRFIDPEARFAFAVDAQSAPPDAIPFDMFGVDYSHHGEHCTFETLCERFEIRDGAVGRLAAIVHDLDLKDDWFQAPETPVVGALIEGLQLSQRDDAALLAQGIALFEALYSSFSGASLPRAARLPPGSSAPRSGPA